MLEDQRAMLPPMGGGEFVEGETIRGQVVAAPPRAREQMKKKKIKGQRLFSLTTDRTKWATGPHAMELRRRRRFTKC